MLEALPRELWPSDDISDDDDPPEVADGSASSTEYTSGEMEGLGKDDESDASDENHMVTSTVGELNSEAYNSTLNVDQCVPYGYLIAGTMPSLNESLVGEKIGMLWDITVGKQSKLQWFPGEIKRYYAHGRKTRNRVVNFDIYFEDGEYDFDLSTQYWTNNELLDIGTTKGAEIKAGMWVHLIRP